MHIKLTTCMYKDGIKGMVYDNNQERGQVSSLGYRGLIFLKRYKVNINILTLKFTKPTTV